MCPENFLVRSNPGGKYQVFQIDFSETHHRDGLAWGTWRDWKYCVDEEGAVGLVMQQRLKGGFEYLLGSKGFLWLVRLLRPKKGGPKSEGPNTSQIPKGLPVTIGHDVIPAPWRIDKS